MTKYVALLRGINVGGNNKVSMVIIKETFESLGFSNVSSYINSGNILFETDTTDLEEKIKTALRKKFDFDIRVVVRTKKSIDKLCKTIPASWTNDALQKTDVLFLWDAFDSKKSIELIQASDIDTLLYIDGAIIWNLHKEHYAKSGMHKFISTPLYKHMTARNINTVRKLGELMK